MKNVLVTGGASGLGKTISEYLINLGYIVFVIDKMVPESLEENYKKSLTGYYYLDLNDIDQIKRLIQSPDFPEINILINNASVRLFKPFYEFTDAEIDLYINVNIRSIVWLSNYIAQKMLKKNYGKIINISSRAAFHGYSSGSLYAATKALLLSLTESIAKDFKYKGLSVTSNVICPSALTELDGRPLVGYNKQIELILKYILNILNTNVNGKCFNTISFTEKIKYLILTIKNLY